MPVTRTWGGFATRDGCPPASFHDTEARLSPAGEVALAAERGEIAPVPVGLINGSSYRDGARPAFRPQGIIGAIREVIGHGYPTMRSRPSSGRPTS
jgi:hypothetical protein